MIDHFKNFLNQKELEDLFKIINNLSWKDTGVDISQSIEANKYSSHLAVTLINSPKGLKPKEKILNIILKKIQDYYKEEYLPHNLYFSYYKFGDEIRMHTDRNTGKKNKTFIFYCTKKWDLNWHGNTVFYTNDALQIIGGSIPYPNTAVCFDSNILHSATPISKFCSEKRILLVYQLEKNNL